MRTERPRSASSRPLRLEPPTRSPSVTLASAPQSVRSDRCPAALSELHSEPPSACGIFIEPDEVAQGHGELGILAGAELIDAQRVLETSDDDGQAERVETRVQEHEIIGQRRQGLSLLSGDLLEPSGDRGPHGHGRGHHEPPVTVVTTGSAEGSSRRGWRMRWISVRRSSTPLSNFAGGSSGSGESVISASSARKSSCVWTTSQTPCTSVYSYSDEPCRFARSAR